MTVPETSRCSEPEAGKIDIYSKNGYDESVFCYLGQDFAINHSFRYESEADAYLSVKNSFYVVADEATLSRMYELQIAAGANADWFRYVFALSDRNEF